MVIVGNAGPPLIWAVFSTLRGYALSGRRWWVAPLIFTFYVPHLVCNCIYYSKLVPTLAPPPFNCLLASGLPEETWIQYTIAGRVCLIVGDMIVLAITWHSTFGIAKAVSIMRMRMSLTNAILKDGTLYFVCLLILNVVNIIINAIPNSSAVSAFQDPITSILVSRFLLNLRDTLGNNERSSRPSFVRSFHGQSVLTSVQFADFVDPMGAELTHSIPSSDTPSMVWSEDDEDDDNGTTGNELASLATNHAPSSNIDGINFQDKDPESVEAHMPAGNDVARFPSLQHDASTRHDVTIVTPAIHNPNP
ncbi:hypothetical protein BD414DRAFT_150706 [Trametes punicea]|nr:hypothetical protein BD414DRAFT_150706 [Trametes punicea]